MKRLFITFAVASVVIAGLAAQQPQQGVRYTPAPGAKDKRAVLFNWAWYMGMLRGPQEIEAVVALEYKGTGTLQVNGQNCVASSYRVSTNYPNTGQRVQYTCKLPSGQEVKNVEVVSGQYTWDEDIAGAELVPGKGHATAKPAALRERVIRLWAGPQGAVKAANAGGDKTTVAEVAGKMTVTFPIPGVAGAIATATLDSKNMAERVEVKDGNTVTEFTYGNYQDWNNPLNKIDAFYAGKIVEKRNGVTVRELTTVETETGNLYVVMPVPPSVKKAASPQSN
jgi:putative hemolysin